MIHNNPNDMYIPSIHILPIGKMRSLLLGLTALLSVSLAACGDDSDNSESIPTVTEVKVSPSAMTFSATGGTTTLYVQSSVRPTVSAGASWLTVEPETSGSTITYKFSVTAPAHTETEDRETNLTISAGTVTRSVAVSQLATDGLLLLTPSFDIPSEGATIDVKLQANGEFSTSISAGWITEAPETRAGMTEYNRSFVVAPNVGSARTGTISFTLGELIESVTITQAAASTSGIMATATEIGSQMYPGWNLGNTLEATGSGLGAETYWQKTRTSQAVIDFVKEQGFRSIRIPCSWDIHSDVATGVIDAAWMARVREVVDYCIHAGLYVELNNHWDNGWIEVLGFSKSSSRYEAVDEEWIQNKITRLKDLWTQIATEFRDYDEHLLFAGLNEPFQEYNLFSTRHETLTPILARYNRAFVEAVRATGGNNTTRTLVVQGPSTSMASTINYYHVADLPEAPGHLMVECHFYEPYQLCGMTDDASWGKAIYFWGAQNLVSGSDRNSNASNDDTFVKSQFRAMKEKFADQGYPVLIGEYGALWRSIDANQTEHDASIRFYHRTVNEEAVNCGMIPFVWDTNACAHPSDDVLNRQTLSVWNNHAMEGIREGAAAGAWPY